MDAVTFAVMNHDYPGVYLRGDSPNTYHSTPLANAGWYDEGQHGGSIAALMAGHIERSIPTLTEMQVSRLTVELFRVIPLVPLRLEAEVVREGKRIQIILGRAFDDQGVLLSTTVMQRLRLADLPVPDDAAPPALRIPAPDQVENRAGDAWGVGATGKTMFHRHAMEVREVVGGFGVKGPGTVWMRLTKPIVAGEETTPLQRLVATADFGNGVSCALDFDEWVFMNPDLTVHVSRYPDGEWVALAAESTYGNEGRGVATGTLWDTSGWLGRSTQSLYLDRMS